MAHLTEQDLVLLAFGEAATDFGQHGDASEHLRTCDRCAAELNAFQHIVELGRETDTAEAPRHHRPPECGPASRKSSHYRHTQPRAIRRPPMYRLGAPTGDATDVNCWWRRPSPPQPCWASARVS